MKLKNGLKLLNHMCLIVVLFIVVMLLLILTPDKVYSCGNCDNGRLGNNLEIGNAIYSEVDIDRKYYENSYWINK